MIHKINKYDDEAVFKYALENGFIDCFTDALPFRNDEDEQQFKKDLARFVRCISIRLE